MENTRIQIESPIKSYDFVDQHGEVLATLKFVPTDLDIFDKYEEVLESFEEMIARAGEIDEQDTKSVLAVKREATELIKDKINYLFNTDASGLFSFAGPLTLMGGDVWGSIVLKKTLEIIEEATGKSMAEMKKNQSKARNQHLNKYPAGKPRRGK